MLTHDNTILGLGTLSTLRLHRTHIYKSRTNCGFLGFCHSIFRIHVSSSAAAQIFIHEPNHLRSRDRLQTKAIQTEVLD